VVYIQIHACLSGQSHYTETVGNPNSFPFRGAYQSPQSVDIRSTDAGASSTMANLHPIAQGLHITLFILGTLSLLLRFYSRAFVVRRWGLDDTLAVATFVCNDPTQYCWRMAYNQQVLYVALQAVHQLMLNAGCGLYVFILHRRSQIAIPNAWL
jgi:hypothetical protein